MTSSLWPTAGGRTTRLMAATSGCPSNSATAFRQSAGMMNGAWIPSSRQHDPRVTHRTYMTGNLLWWVLPGVLAGMPMPFVHLNRRMSHGGPLAAYGGHFAVFFFSAVRADGFFL